MSSDWRISKMTASQMEQIKDMRLQGDGYLKIAQTLGLSRDTVRSFCRRNDLNDNTKKKGSYCQHCGKPMKIIPKRKPKKFCSDACRATWWNNHPECVTRKAIYDFVCATCGRSFTAYGNQKRKYCCHKCYIADRFGGGDAPHE